jgi:hypothetical protein
MGTSLDHRHCAEQCVAMAQRSGTDVDKTLWLTLAQSWLTLAEQAAHPLFKSDCEADAELDAVGETVSTPSD